MLEMLESKNVDKLDAQSLLSCIKWYKEYELINNFDGETDEYLDAFVALGGEYDRTGTIFKNTLIEIIKIEFELTIDMVVSALPSVLTNDMACRNTCKRSEETPRKLTTTPSVFCLTLARPETRRASAVTFQTTKDPPS